VIVVPVLFTARPFLNLAVAHVALGPDRAVAPDLEVETLREGVDDRDSNAVQATGDLVAAAVAELAAGVQRGQHNLRRRLVLGLLHFLHGDPASVVDHRAAVVGMQGHRDSLRMAGDRLVHGVVHNLVDEVVQATGAGRADVHAGSLSNGLEALEDGDVLRPVGGTLRLAAGLACGAPGSTAGAGGALLAGSSALGGIRHSASFQSNQGDAYDLRDPARKVLADRGSRPHSSTHKSTSREPRKLRQRLTNPLQIAN
jgi:hypothetical protein